MRKISVVVPCYNEQESIPYFYEEIKRIEQKLADYEFEIILIDDGSSDDTLKIAKNLAGKDSQIKYVSFSRNFGKEAAIYAGLRYSSGDFVVMMDARPSGSPIIAARAAERVSGRGIRFGCYQTGYEKGGAADSIVFCAYVL